MTCHLRENFKDSTIFVNEGDVFCECYFFGCRLIFSKELEEGWWGDFEGCHLSNCHLMSMEYYLSTGGH